MSDSLLPCMLLPVSGCLSEVNVANSNCWFLEKIKINELNSGRSLPLPSFSQTQDHISLTNINFALYCLSGWDGILSSARIYIL